MIQNKLGIDAHLYYVCKTTMTTLPVKKIFVPIIAAFLLLACTNIVLPRSNKNKQKEKPSVMLLNSFVDFRMEQGVWPVSKNDFISKGKKYAESFAGFRYNSTRFKIIDNDQMVFYFSDHVRYAAKYEPNTVDLSDLAGEAKFYKENGKFLWKLKMY